MLPKSILIANRGEIAIRIMRTAKKMGIKTFALQTPQEANALYLKYADEIIKVREENLSGPVFLNIEELITYAKEYKIDSIHPGYGFLSENPELAKRCEDEGILFIGPSHESIHAMGNKNVAKELASTINIPLIKGSKGAILNFQEAKRQAAEIGYPIMLKALAGGGGKGMRVVRKEKELETAYKLAVNEAVNAFNNGAMLIEKYIEHPRHIEVQILADKHGNAIHLFERECSIQRKHQKLLEEAPSAVLSEALRSKMGQLAIKLCKYVGYSTLGTVEFLLDSQNNFYFLEMNTRVQVEHPVTEAITGIDLIEQQIRTAAGEKLQLKQSDLKINGWAIELRINAEDVQAGFAPNFGIIDEMEFPDDVNLRVDTGFVPGSVIPSMYDSMIAKLIITGKTREEAVENAIRILQDSSVKGIKTTIPFFKATLRHPDFVSGKIDTSFVQEKLDKTFHQEHNEEMAAAAIALQAYLDEIRRIEEDELDSTNASPWISRMLNKLS